MSTTGSFQSKGNNRHEGLRGTCKGHAHNATDRVFFILVLHVGVWVCVQMCGIPKLMLTAGFWPSNWHWVPAWSLSLKFAISTTSASQLARFQSVSASSKECVPLLLKHGRLQVSYHIHQLYLWRYKLWSLNLHGKHFNHRAPQCHLLLFKSLSPMLER